MNIGQDQVSEAAISKFERKPEEGGREAFTLMKKKIKFGDLYCAYPALLGGSRC
jgi:hypothetical protein